MFIGRKRGKDGGLEADEKRLKADELPEREAAAKRLEAAELPERESGCKAVEKRLKAADAMA